MKTLRMLGVAVVALCVSGASSFGLGIGDPAPALTVGKWVKGEAVKGFEPGKVYVVEFWVTWCGPCKVSIPHLTEMAHKYKDVTFIGTDAWEHDDALVEPFVKEMGDKMDYHVVMDDKTKEPKGAMAVNWMDAANQNGIPTAFIVGKEGKILWIGHPMAMEKSLGEVVGGTYDIAVAKAAFDKQVAEQAVAQKLSAEINEALNPPMKAKDYPAALKAVDGLMEKHPEAKKTLLNVKLSVSVQAKQWDVVYATTDEMAKAFDDDAQEMNQLAWIITTSKAFEKHDFDRALKYAQRAVELSKGEDGQIMDTLARVYFEKGDVAKAIATEEKAVGKVTGDEKTQLTETLAKYKAAAK